MDSTYDIENVSVDSAWESKQYGLVLTLLQRDHYFPDSFDVEELNEEDELQRNLKVFVQERNLLHEWIKHDQLEKVKELTSRSKSKYYLNERRQSAAFSALEKRNFKIYAYLQSIGASLREFELSEMEKLTPMEKHELRDVMLSTFSTSAKSHIYYLISKMKIKSQNSFEQYTENLFGYIEKLNQFPSVSIILKVIQYVDNLSLVLDLDNENVKTVCPPASTAEQGVTFHFLETIYVAAGAQRSENEVLGTIAHELTHMAMQIVFKNNCNPYFKSDDVARDGFEKIISSIKTNLDVIPNTSSETLHKSFSNYYKKLNQEESELIARVSHVIVQYPEGEAWLMNYAPKLFQFFKEKVVFVCEKFIEQNSLLKLKSLNRCMNESEGEIISIKKCDLLFVNVEKIKNFLNDASKNIFALITQYTWLGLLRALQAIYGVDYAESYDQFLVFKLKNVVTNLEQVEYVFNSEATEVLFIECPDIIGDDCLGAIENLMEIVQEKKDKKIIFIMKEEENKDFLEILEDLELKDAFSKKIDENFSICELTEESRSKILDGAVLFQGKELNLGSLINGDEDLLKCVDAGEIQDVLKKKIIEIGSQLFGTSSLEGAYSDVMLEVYLETLIDEMKYSENVFVVNGRNLVDRKFFEDLNGISITSNLINCEYETSTNKRIFLTNEQISDNEFRIFCNFNPKKKVYLLGKTRKSTFILFKFYNPEFYYKRRFKRYEKVVIRKDILENENNEENISDVFVIGNNRNDDLQNNAKSSKLILLDLEKAKDAFEKFSQSESAVHLLKCENDKLIWVKSSGSLSGLHEWIDRALSKEIVKNEIELISRIKNDKVVILADDPGMGKSTTLTKLYETEEIFNDYWVIRINLKDHLDAIRKIKMDSNININEVLKFLTEIDSKLKNNISKKFLEAAVDINKNFTKILLLCFDGFDELLDEEDRKKMVSLLKFIQKSTKCKIWITTRLHFKKNLENELLVLSIKFDPIDNLSKIDFIKNYMKDRLKLTLSKEKYNEIFEKIQGESKLQIYTKQFLDKAKTIFKGDIERFIGTPLQLHLLLEDSAPSFRNWIDNSDGLDFSYLGNNLLEVYEQFFNRKYEIYYRKKNILEKESKSIMKDTFEKCHEQLAESLVNNKPLVYDILKRKSSLLLLGITKTEGDNIQFVHFTFREYFFTQFIIKDLVNQDDKSQESYELFLKKILVEGKYELIRSFVNIFLENIENRAIFKKYEKRFHDIIVSSYRNKAYGTAMEENNYNIFDFLLTLNFDDYEYFRILENIGGSEPLFHFAVKLRNDSLLRRIIDLASTYNSDQLLLTSGNAIKNTAFHLAIAFKNDVALNRIIQLALKHNLYQQLITTVNLFERNAFLFAVSFKNDFAFNQIVKLALKYDIDYELLIAVDNDRYTAFTLAVAHNNHLALDRIIELASKYDLHQKLLTDTDKYENTAFHLAVKNKNDFALNRIIELAETYNISQQLLTAVYDTGSSVFHCGVFYKNDFALNRILELALEHNLEQQLLLSVNKYENTALHLAVQNKNDFALDRIIGAASKYNLVKQLLTTFGYSKNTAFHLAVLEKNDFALNRIIELALKLSLIQTLLTAVNNTKCSAFHFAVWYKNDFALDRIIELALECNLERQLITTVNKNKNTALHLAIVHENEFAFNRILELSSKYNLHRQLLTAVDNDNNTASRLAVQYKNEFALSKIKEIESQVTLKDRLRWINLNLNLGFLKKS